MTMAKNVYETLSKVDVSKHIEKKGDISYLSWTWAWAFVKSNFDDATFEKHTFTDNQNNVLPFMRDYKGNTYVQVSVTIQGQTITEVFPVMDNYMSAINTETNTKFGKKKRDGQSRIPDATDVNNAHQRALTKCLAYFGLGLNVYAGEDIPLNDVFFKDDKNDAEAGGIIKEFDSAKNKAELEEAWAKNAKKINGLSKTVVISVQEHYKACLAKVKLKAAQ